MRRRRPTSRCAWRGSTRCPETALQELDGIVERQTKEATTIKTAKLGGVKAAADMINLLGHRARRR